MSYHHWPTYLPSSDIIRWTLTYLPTLKSDAICGWPLSLISSVAWVLCPTVHNYVMKKLQFGQPKLMHFSKSKKGFVKIFDCSALKKKVDKRKQPTAYLKATKWKEYMYNQLINMSQISELGITVDVCVIGTITHQSLIAHLASVCNVVNFNF